MPEETQIKKLTQILQECESIPLEQRQKWIAKLPTLPEAQFTEAEKLILDAHQKIQGKRKDFVVKLEDFQKTKMCAIFQVEEAKERQQETADMENILAQM